MRHDERWERFHRLRRFRRKERRTSPRLHWQIFRALVATGLLCFVMAMSAAWLLRGEERMPGFVQDVGDFILADMASEPSAFQKQLEHRALRLHASLSVWDQHGVLVARAGRELGPRQLPPGKRRWHDHGEAMRIPLRDGRTLAVMFDEGNENHLAYLLCGIGFVLFTLNMGSYLAARRITRRLERLERGVARFGEGALDVRVHVRGRDEIASLANVFNRSFDRIAGLLKQQRRMLQSASHELRSPLARLRMALELSTEPGLSAEALEKLRSDATRDIEELDALIGDLLLAGRLADTELPKDFVEVSLWPIVESEAAQVSARVEGQPEVVLGNPRMLRSLVRNLLENARRYGRDPITASLAHAGNEIVLRVEDKGDGVSTAERERIFEAFYRPAGHREGKDGGVGLGLSLVQNIAQHHGGSVRYVPCEGSCFEVRLPNRRISVA
ncbi:MAG TPA: ATP-binding protein [Polyangiales bacterium]|nr:ATP-binding protein [Polyangiales bacterium]